jgi:hypothetical protein
LGFIGRLSTKKEMWRLDKRMMEKHKIWINSSRRMRKKMMSTKRKRK